MFCSCKIIAEAKVISKIIKNRRPRPCSLNKYKQQKVNDWLKAVRMNGWEAKKQRPFNSTTVKRTENNSERTLI